MSLHKAGIAQLVEHDLAKVGVEGSSPFSRSKFSFDYAQAKSNESQKSRTFVPAFLYLSGFHRTLLVCGLSLGRWFLNIAV
jgi:hypothetical protein